MAPGQHNKVTYPCYWPIVPNAQATPRPYPLQVNVERLKVNSSFGAERQLTNHTQPTNPRRAYQLQQLESLSQTTFLFSERQDTPLSSTSTRRDNGQAQEEFPQAKRPQKGGCASRQDSHEHKHHLDCAAAAAASPFLSSLLTKFLHTH